MIIRFFYVSLIAFGILSSMENASHAATVSCLLYEGRNPTQIGAIPGVSPAKSESELAITCDHGFYSTCNGNCLGKYK